MKDFGELMRQVAPLLGYDPRAADPKGVARYRSHGASENRFRSWHVLRFADPAKPAASLLSSADFRPELREWLDQRPARKAGLLPSPRDGGEQEGRSRRRTQGSHKRIEARAPLPRDFERAEPIAGVSEVAGYLASRCGSSRGSKTELRHSRDQWKNPQRPCLLAAYRSLDTDEITGIVRIAVDEPESWPKSQRKMLGVVRRAAVKLVPVTDTLAVAEGVETAVAANMLGHGPAWALGSAGAVANLPVLPGIERLILLQENNDVSRNAVDRCGKRWLRAGRKVSRVKPHQERDDLNDELISRGMINGYHRRCDRR